MTFISKNIISENTLSANTSNINTVYCNTLSATTLYGNGSNLTNISLGLLTGSSPNFSVQYNNNGTISGTSRFLYSANTLFFTGTTRLNGQFYQKNSPSVKLVHQWYGPIQQGIAPGTTWVMQANENTWLFTGVGPYLGFGENTYLTDLTEYTQCRLFTSIQVSAATAGAKLSVLYSNPVSSNPTDALTGTYYTLVSTEIGGTGAKDSGWSGITSAANGLVFIKLVGSGGNGIDAPRFSPPVLLIR